MCLTYAANCNMKQPFISFQWRKNMLPELIESNFSLIISNVIMPLCLKTQSAYSRIRQSYYQQTHDIILCWMFISGTRRKLLRCMREFNEAMWSNLKGLFFWRRIGLAIGSHFASLRCCNAYKVVMICKCYLHMARIIWIMPGSFFAAPSGVITFTWEIVTTRSRNI